MTDQEQEESCLYIGTAQARSDHRPSRAFISVVAPAYNEELNLSEFYRQVSDELSRLSVDWEIIFVDDGSRDNSRAILEKLHRRDSRVKAILFARNFGHQIALSAGLAAARGDAVIMMDSDLQHPVELLPKMISEWLNGFHIVHTVRQYGNKVSWRKKTLSELFYKFMNHVSGTKIEPGAADFKLLDRRIVDLLNQMPEQTRFLRALIPWLGFRQTSVPFTCRDRFAGTPSYTSLKSLELAVDGIISFTTRPLRWITYLGAVVLSMTVPYGIWAVIDHFLIGATERGWTSLVWLNLLLGGATLVSLGIIGEYIGRIYNEVKRRPLYTVEKTLGLDEESAETAQLDLASGEPAQLRKIDRQRVA